MLSLIWSLVHDPQIFEWGNGRFLFVGYNLVPWIGVMALGYCFGRLYVPSINPDKRKKILLRLGSFIILLFVALRWSNLYGDLHPWSLQETWYFTLLSFLNASKYPASFLYLLITLGPAILLLAFTEKVSGWLSGALITVGRVPMFFYILHIYLIHLLALAAALHTGYPASAMVFNTWITNSQNLKGYGFSLWVVYVVWIAVVVGLYPLCKAYEKYKRDNQEKWWLSYL